MNTPANTTTVHPAKPEAPVDKAFAALGEEVRRAEALATNLRDRLEPVLTPGGCADGGKGEEPRPVRAPMEDLVLNTASYLRGTNDALRDLLDRLAV